MRSRALPPGVPSPARILADGHGPSRPQWVHALTPCLFVLAWVVAFAAVAASRGRYGGVFYPLAAIGVCGAVVPIARATRRRLDATSAQAAYLALAFLTPWLVFAWNVAARMDHDGDSGGALGVLALVGSSLLLVGVMPVTLFAFQAMPVLRARRWPALASAVFVAGLALYGAAFSARHPTADGLVAYRELPVVLHPSSAPGEYEQRLTEGMWLRQRRAGSRCATRLVSRSNTTSQELSHACASPVRAWMSSWDLRRAWLNRPTYAEMVFASAEGEAIGRKGAPRYLLFTAPLWEWIAGALLGVLVGLGTLAVARRGLARWRRLPVRQATASGGCARCADGAVVPLPGALARYVGPVLVIGSPELGAPFRNAPQRKALVVPGDLSAWRRALSDCESVATSFALAAIWLPAAPLLASPFLGMLSELR